LDETWQMGLRPEKTKPCTFPAKSRYEFRREREKWVAEASFFCQVDDAPLLPLSFHRFPPNFPRIRVLGGGSRHLVSHSRKVSIKGSNFPKNRLFRVQKGTLFVPRLRVTGNVLRRLDSFRPLVDIPQIYPSMVTFVEGCTVFQLSTSECLRILCHGISNCGTWMLFLSNIFARRRNDRIDDLHWYTPPVHIF